MPPSIAMLTTLQYQFLDRRRVARLATADRNGVPHVVPVCFAVYDGNLYITIDEKPKQPGRLLKRLRNLAQNPYAAVIVDQYEEDWSRLGWLMLRGPTEILPSGPEHDAAQALLRSRYPQYAAMSLGKLPVIALRIERATAWGNLGS